MHFARFISIDQVCGTPLNVLFILVLNVLIFIYNKHFKFKQIYENNGRKRYFWQVFKYLLGLFSFLDGTHFNF